jgi:prepilin-type N-terminal cleavage/methylation domain-containing protein
MIASTCSEPSYRRDGFTLVEVLVAMALIIFIMVILAEAFTAGLGTFGTLKSLGDMQERLRAAETLIRDDVVHRHFDGSQRLSTLANHAPRAGYLYIRQCSSVPEGTDSYGVGSYRKHAGSPPVLCFTVNLYHPPQLQPAVSDTSFLASDFFAARIPLGSGYPGPLPALTATERLLFDCGPADYLPAPLSPRGPPSNNVFLSQWAEIGYAIFPLGHFAGTTQPQPLYSLRRRVRAVLLPGRRARPKRQPPSPSTEWARASTTYPWGPPTFTAPAMPR